MVENLKLTDGDESISEQNFEIKAPIFRHMLPRSRMGEEHKSHESYSKSVGHDGEQNDPTLFSLVVLLSSSSPPGGSDIRSNLSILLGKKLRGFGKGFFNCFGGKLEKSLNEFDHPARGAIREVKEESGIDVPLKLMEDGYIGTLNFTFDDYETNKAMRVYLFCVFISLSRKTNDSIEVSQDEATIPTIMVDPALIRGCDEIEPRWFENIYDIPLNEMFADDSLWLVMILRHHSITCSNRPKLMFEGYFHFQAGGSATNKISHHFIQTNLSNGIPASPSTNKSSKMKYTLEEELFHALHLNHIHSPSIKEFKENWAMANAVRRFMGDENRMEYVIDVAGGHGALGALFLLLVRKCHTAIVIDPAIVSGKEGIRQAWSSLWSGSETGTNGLHLKSLRYRHECLRTGLRDELDAILCKKGDDHTDEETKTTSVLVVACHACQHLTDETMQIAAEYGVNVACMPCCQKDHDGRWKQIAKQIVKPSRTAGLRTDADAPPVLSIGAIMDVLAAGKMMAWNTGAQAGIRYEVKMKLIDEKISPLQNRMILCKAVERESGKEDYRTAVAHQKLTSAYRRAHRINVKNYVDHAPNVSGVELPVQKVTGRGWRERPSNSTTCFTSLIAGFSIGISLSLLITCKLRQN